MIYGLDKDLRCIECGERIKDRLFDHTEGCPVGRDERILFAHPEYVDCLKEFEKFMGPCPTHGTPDFPNAMQQLHRWKELLVAARHLLAQGIHQEKMSSTWTEECKSFINEVGAL